MLPERARRWKVRAGECRLACGDFPKPPLLEAEAHDGTQLHVVGRGTGGAERCGGRCCGLEADRHAACGAVGRRELLPRVAARQEREQKAPEGIFHKGRFHRAYQYRFGFCELLRYEGESMGIWSMWLT